MEGRWGLSVRSRGRRTVAIWALAIFYSASTNEHPATTRKNLPGAGCDELVGKTEAVAVITADPVGGDAAEPGFS